MEEYSSNSHKSKQQNELEEKKINSVVSGSVKTKKKNEVQKFADVFISEDVANVKSYILMDVLVPAIKKAISDIVTNSIDMILYGEAGRSKKSNGSSKVSYRSYYENPSRRESSGARARTNDFDFDDLIFDKRGDAEAVLTAMDDIIERYQIVSVGDLYDLAHVSTDNYMVNKYGWTDIRNASVIRVRDGYVIKLPKAMPLN